MVGGIEFKIVLKKIKDYGEMHIDKKTIYIRKGLSPEESFDTMMHEVVHAALSISGLSDILNDDNMEEAIVRASRLYFIPRIQKRIWKLQKKETIKKYDVGIQILNKFDVKAYSEEEAEEIVRNMDSGLHLLDSAFRINYIYQV